MKAKVIYSFFVKILLGLGLVVLLTAIGFMGAFPGLTASVLPLVIFFLLPLGGLALAINTESTKFNQLQHLHHPTVNSWQPIYPPGYHLTREDELDSLKAQLSNLKSDEQTLEGEIQFLAGSGAGK
jgi:hypothetical protein